MHKPIQITDSHGTVIGVAQSPKDAVLAKQVRLVSRVIITNESGQILLQKRARDMVAWPGKWDSSAAGHVDEGEDPLQAAYRELKEEIGLEVTLNFERRFYHEKLIEDGFVNKTYNFVYSGIFNGELGSLQLEPKEVDCVDWFTIDEITQRIHNEPSSVTDGLIALFGEGK